MLIGYTDSLACHLETKKKIDFHDTIFLNDYFFLYEGKYF